MVTCGNPAEGRCHKGVRGVSQGLLRNLVKRNFFWFVWLPHASAVTLEKLFKTEKNECCGKVFMTQQIFQRRRFVGPTLNKDHFSIFDFSKKKTQPGGGGESVGFHVK